MIKDMEALHFRAGDVIFHEGEVAGSVYLIDKGKVEITKNNGATTISLATLGFNELFGEMALIDNDPRSATATALQDTWVYMLKKDVFIKQIDDLQPFLQAVFSILVKSVREMTNSQVQQLTQ